MGCNTWDLMDKARYDSERDEVKSRMDAMVKAGWRVGRTWGFSLGTGTGQSGALGETVLDPSSVLETAPGAAVCLPTPAFQMEHCATMCLPTHASSASV